MTARQMDDMIVIAVGSSTVGLLLMLVAIGCIVVCIWLLKCHQRKYTFSTNVAYDSKRVEDHFELSDCEVITDDKNFHEQR